MAGQAEIHIEAALHRSLAGCAGRHAADSTQSGLKGLSTDALPDAAERAVAEVEEHLRSDAAGRCMSCGQTAPCHSRNLAHAALFAAGILPQRRTAIDRSTAARFDAATGRRR